MSGTEWAVVITGSAAIAWVNWYFFLDGRRAPQRESRQAGAEKE